MNDTSSLVDMRSLKIKSIDGQTYELTVPKDVSDATQNMRVISQNFNLLPF